jgi:hypothetical protein
MKVPFKFCSVCGKEKLEGKYCPDCGVSYEKMSASNYASFLPPEEDSILKKNHDSSPEDIVVIL